MKGETLRLIRVFHDMSVPELSKELGVTTQHIYNMECGSQNVTLATVEKYAKAFDIPVSTILFMSETGKKVILEKIRKSLLTFLHNVEKADEGNNDA